MKYVLQNILVFWSTVAKLHAFIKNMIRQIFTNFLWKGEKNPSSYILASWSSIAKPKSLGGWGIRDLDIFNKYLAVKSLWRDLFHKGLWGEITRKKYLKGVEVVSWLQKKHTSFPSASIIWKNIFYVLPIVKNWVAWKVGSGLRVLLGLVPFIGVGSGYRLSDGLLVHLHCQGLYSLAQFFKVGSSNILGPQAWPSAQDIGLPASFAGEWNSFIQVINLSGLTLSDEPDSLAWTWNKEDGVVTVKEAYNALTYLLVDEDYRWWYSLISKIKAASKIILFMWLCLENKALT